MQASLTGNMDSLVKWYALILPVCAIFVTLTIFGCDKGSSSSAETPNDVQTSELSLGQPSNVRATSTAERIQLVWDGVVNASHYRVYWAEQSPVLALASNQKVFTEQFEISQGLKVGQSYHFVIVAENETMTGPASAVHVVALQLTKPSSVLALDCLDGDAHLYWEAVSGVTGYQLYWSFSSELAQWRDHGGIEVQSPFQHQDRQSSERYYYYIVALKDELASDPVPALTKNHCLGQSIQDSYPDNRLGPEMIVIPALSYRMGDDTSFGGLTLGEGSSDELPVHQVTFQQAFAIGKYEVTFHEYDQYLTAIGKVTGTSESEEAYDWQWGREERPVIGISWDDISDYLDWLNMQFDLTGKPGRYRLPTEAEWEYVARAGSRTKYPWGDEIGVSQAHCEACDSDLDTSKTAPVGAYPANAWGLHDMHGNINEWLADCKNANYTDAPLDGRAWLTGACTHHMVRGGSWVDGARNLRSANRTSHARSYRNNTLGFRLAKTL